MILVKLSESLDKQQSKLWMNREEGGREGKGYYNQDILYALMRLSENKHNKGYLKK